MFHAGDGGRGRGKFHLLRNLILHEREFFPRDSSQIKQ